MRAVPWLPWIVVGGVACGGAAGPGPNTPEPLPPVPVGNGDGFVSRGHATPGRTVAMQIGEVTVGDGLPAEQVELAIRARFGRFRACYARTIEHDPSAAGHVVLRFTIGLAGDVTDAGAAGIAGDLDDCIAAITKTIAFPRPTAPVVVRFPFTFSAE